MASPDARQRRAQAAIAAELARIGFALPGSLFWRSTTCGKTGCRCQADPPVLHGPYLTWTRKVDNKTVTRTLNPDQAERLRPLIDNARRLRELVAELETLALANVDDAPPTVHS